MGFDAQGKRIRRKLSGRTKTEVQEALNELREERGRAPKSSRIYTVNEAVAEWLNKGLPGRAERTRDLYKYATRGPTSTSPSTAGPTWRRPPA